MSGEYLGQLPPTAVSTPRTSVELRRSSDEASPIRTPGILAHVMRGAPARIITSVMDVAVVPLGPDLLLLRFLSKDLKPSKKAMTMN